MGTEPNDLAVLITCKQEAIKLMGWLKKRRAKAICSSVNAYLLLHSEGLGDTLELIDLPLPGDKGNALLDLAERLARALDVEVARYLGELTGSQVAQGWEFWDKWLFATSLMQVRAWLQAYDLSGLPERVAICDFASSQDYFHPSRVRSQIYADALRQAGKHVVKIPIDFPLGPPHTAGVWRSTYRLSIRASQLRGTRLVHLPTAFYAQATLVELHRSEAFLDLESPYYENPILLKRIALDRDDLSSRSWPIDMEQPKHLYQEFLAALGLADVDGVSQQVVHWLDRLAFQYRTFRMLLTLRDGHGVSLEAIADHDGGLFGPLCSVFREQSHPVKIYPHSTINVGPVPNIHSEVMAVMESMRPLQPFDGANLPLVNFKPAAPRPFNREACIAIVLNEIDDVSGVPLHGFKSMLGFLKELVSGLEGLGLRPVLRPRPSMPVASFCDFAVDVRGGDLGELIAESAACIGVGQPTTALCKFWSAGVACLHVQDRELSVSDLYTLPNSGLHCFAGKPFMAALPGLIACIEGLFATSEQR